MGQDKALLDFGGQPLIQHLLTRLASLTDDVIITTNHPEDYKFLGVPLIADIILDRGSLGGLLTALSSASQPYVAVVACDMPFASVDLLNTCLDILSNDPNIDAVIPSTESGLEPLHAVYRRHTCLPAVKIAIDTNKWKLTAWHNAVNVHILSPEKTLHYDPDGIVFWNLNTLEDLELARKKFITR